MKRRNLKVVLLMTMISMCIFLTQAQESITIRDIEKDIVDFLEHATQGDTLSLPENMVDSQYTPLLIKNLSNDKEVYIQRTLHGDAIKTVRFLGIKLKEKQIGYSETYYETVRMSDFVKSRLREILHPIYWNFDLPDANASVEEWQVWLDKLCK